MTEPNVGTPLVNSVKSLLEKPIHQLTEDDIAQLTREDCRRYLKDKGMRRPSWNKSQAIQQVIMLKSLLETPPDSEAGPRKRPRTLNHDSSCENANSVSENVRKEMRSDAEDWVTAKEMAPFSGQNVEERDEPYTPRMATAKKVPGEQMTIFYCGKVNVYDDVPADKAQAVMRIAASPPPFPQEQMADDVRILQPLPSPNYASSRACLDSADVFSPAMRTVRLRDNIRVGREESHSLHAGIPAEGPSTRKASVQRYLEKKKDRFKRRTRAGMSSCADFDTYFNHPTSDDMSSSWTRPCTPRQIRPPRTLTRCISAGNHSVKNN